MLILIATPLGNLQDISFRAIETLKQVDYVLCEDTRHSRILLEHYCLTTPLRSYHKFNEAKAEQQILDDLAAGMRIALISDAGTPGISDPGERLVATCVKNGFKVSSIPGPCAAIAALSCSGFPTTPFQFNGFLPKKEGALTEILEEALFYEGTSIFYESPHRLLETLAHLHILAPRRRLCIARELTKKFEEYVHGNAEDLIALFTKKGLKGECILLIAPGEKNTPLEEVDPKVAVLFTFLTHSQGFTRRDALGLVSKAFEIPKQKLYKLLPVET